MVEEGVFMDKSQQLQPEGKTDTSTYSVSSSDHAVNEEKIKQDKEYQMR
jgi:hypothetical protein